jgi:protein-disulfide isomerase
VGGAERSARKRRQTQAAASPAPAAKRGTGDRKKVIIGVVVVVLLAGAVVGGVIYTNSQKNATEGQSITTASSSNEASYPVRRDGAVVVVGEDDAKVTLDVYEDFLCPACRAFEDSYGKEIEQRVEDGTVRVRYHMLPMLNERSDPPGYSMDSANAGLCAADAGKFPEFHLSLFGAQPEEGSRGWDRKQLAELGAELGITSSSFKSCVDSGKYNSLIQTNFDKVAKTPYLQQEVDGERSFGTPTIAVGEKVVEPSDPNWLDKLVSAD